MKKIDWENVKANEDSERLPAGGYEVEIKAVKDEPSKEYLYIEYDIAEGDFRNYYKDLEERLGFWGGKMYRSYKESAQGMFKGFLNAVIESNKGFVWDDDEKKLVGACVGLVLSEEEYIGNDGSKKTRLYVSAVKPIADIRAGKFKVREKKLLKEEPATAADSFEAVNADSPF